MPDVINVDTLEVPPQCLDCPIAKACIEARDTSAALVAKTAILLETINEVMPEELGDAVQASCREILEIRQDPVKRYSRWLKFLTGNAEPCPGSRRGAPPYASRLWKIEAYLRNDRVCRSPGLSKIFEE